ncbi:MAG: molybdopterin dehydrogenase [Gammaproteobacteria bacterium]|nr:molybdopterin dehydrogenase [Gammaproteobacteria bacterium]
MKPVAFKYLKPATVEEATAFLAEYGSEAKILAGGQSMMPMLSMRIARPSVLVDINEIAELTYIRAADDAVAIGSVTRQRRLGDDDLVAEQVPVLASALKCMSHPQIQNRGTVVGSICHGDPAAELPAVAIALGAELTACSQAGTRTIPVAEFYRGYYRNILEPDELVSEVNFPAMLPGCGWSVVEISRRHGDLALAGVASLVAFAGEEIDHVRIACFGLGKAAHRLVDAESLLKGQRTSSELFQEVASLVSSSVKPMDDSHASAEYRRALAAELTQRSLFEAIERAKQGAAS